MPEDFLRSRDACRRADRFTDSGGTDLVHASHDSQEETPVFGDTPDRLEEVFRRHSSGFGGFGHGVTALLEDEVFGQNLTTCQFRPESRFIGFVAWTNLRIRLCCGYSFAQTTREVFGHAHFL